jgi:hypothetical protein
MDPPDLLRRAEEYARERSLILGDRLGYGVQGIVFQARNQDEGQSAIKVHSQETAYRRERNVYSRLRENGIVEIHGSHVPELLNHDDGRLILDMTVVDRPFVLDFGGAFLDFPPDFFDEVLAEWLAEKQEQFGHRWTETAAILRYLEDLGIFVIDVNPRNISWRD